jgi:hypothetical protein
MNDANIFEHTDGSVRRDFHHDVDVAVRSLLAEGDGSKQGGASHSPRAQGARAFS